MIICTVYNVGGVHTGIPNHWSLPPSLSSALPCADSKSLKAKHWYKPLCSRCTEGRRRGEERCSRRGAPSLYQAMDCSGWPDTEQLKTADWPTSTTWRCGWTNTDRGAENKKNEQTLVFWLVLFVQTVSRSSEKIKSTQLKTVFFKPFFFYKHSMFIQ